MLGHRRPDHNLGMPMGWSTGADETRSLAGLETAWQHGARLYDTADVYVYGHGRSERLLGWLVAQVPRHEIVLASKVGYFTGTAEHGYEPRHMRRQLEQSLDNLRTDHLDIYTFHHPNFGTNDRWLSRALEAMRAFRDKGLIRAIGMRGPHRFASDRLTTPPDQRGDKSPGSAPSSTRYNPTSWPSETTSPPSHSSGSPPSVKSQ
jgi:methylglyoxal reductase